MLVEDGHGAVQEGHYYFRQTGTTPEHRTAAEQHLARQGCTKVVHYEQDAVLVSIGHIERLDVVAQRAREPRYD